MNSKPIPPSNVHPRPATQEQIAALAHELWRERGCPEGSDIDIWLEAERELNGGAIARSSKDPIPADLRRSDVDSDPAVNPNIDRQLRDIGGPPEQRSPTSFGV